MKLRGIVVRSVARHARRRFATGLALLAGCLSAAPALALDESLLQPVEYRYHLSRGGSKVGNGVISLRNTDRPGCYLYSQEARPTAFWVKLLSSDVVEQSWFCVQDSGVVPTTFRYHRDGIGASRENFAVTFDWTRSVATTERGSEYPVEAGIVDRLLMQLVLRDWILTTVRDTGKLPDGEKQVRFADRNKVDDYTFAVRAEETVKVPAGSFPTIRLDRTDSTHRRTQFWLAPDLNYAVVKAEQQRDDDPVVGLVLTKVPR